MLGIQYSLGGIGTINSNQSICVFRVRKFQELVELVKFFDNYPLISRKRVDYLLFKQILSIIQLKEHFTLQGLQNYFYNLPIESINSFIDIPFSFRSLSNARASSSSLLIIDSLIL